MYFSIKTNDEFAKSWKSHNTANQITAKPVSILAKREVISITATHYNIDYRGKHLRIPVEAVNKMYLVKSKNRVLGMFSPLETILQKKYSLKIVLHNGKEISFRVAAGDRHLFLDVIAQSRNLRVNC